MLVRLIVAVAAIAISLCARGQTSEKPLPCIGQVCLGMTLDEVAKLDLVPGSDLEFNSAFQNAVGIDSAGTYIKFVVSVIDRPAIEQIQKKLRTICSIHAPWRAYTKASDGRRIELALYPRMVNGRTQVAVVWILRAIPEIKTAAQRKEYDDQLREKYGDLYHPHPHIRGPDLESAQVRIERGSVSSATGEHVIALRLPSWMNKEQLMGQLGCTEKLKLD